MIKYTRLAQEKDIDAIIKIIDEAKQFLKEAGSPQWQSGYPNIDTITEDIKKGNGYVFVVGEQVAAYAAIVIGDDPNYQEIDGAWKNTKDKYATVHRICISSAFQGQGLAKIFYSNIISLMVMKGIHNFRVDTYKLNRPMQKLALDNGYEHRGIIIIIDDPLDPDRLAYELNLNI